MTISVQLSHTHSQPLPFWVDYQKKKATIRITYPFLYLSCILVSCSIYVTSVYLSVCISLCLSRSVCLSISLCLSLSLSLSLQFLSFFPSHLCVKYISTFLPVSIFKDYLCLSVTQTLSPSSFFGPEKESEYKNDKPFSLPALYIGLLQYVCLHLKIEPSNAKQSYHLKTRKLSFWIKSNPNGILPWGSRKKKFLHQWSEH